MKNGNESTIIAGIAAESKKINAVADEASAYVKSVEKQLLETDVGVTVWGPILSEEESHFTPGDAATPVDARRVMTLGLGKVKSKWGFAIQEQIFTKRRANDKECTQLSEEKVTLLRKSDRDLRILAMPLIPELLEKILEAVKAKASELTASDDGNDETDAAEESALLVEAADAAMAEGDLSDEADLPVAEEAAQMQ
jgi:hypothetical protein